MAGEDPKDQDPGRDDSEEITQDGPEDEEKEPPADPPEGPEKKDGGKPKLDPELKRAIDRRDRALRDRDAAKEEIRRLKEKYEPEKADPVKVANRRLVTAEAKVVLTAKGITDPADQKEVSAFLGLDSVAVSDDGDVDSDEIQDRVEKLARIFGKVGGGTRRGPRLDTRDRGGDRQVPKDDASKRRRDMLAGR